MFNLIKLYNLRGILHVHAHVHGPRPYEVGFCHEFRLNFTLIFKSLEGEHKDRVRGSCEKVTIGDFFAKRFPQEKDERGKAEEANPLSSINTCYVADREQSSSLGSHAPEFMFIGASARSNEGEEAAACPLVLEGLV